MEIVVVGPGRAGTAVHAGLAARGHAVALTRDVADARDADVVLLAVPDDAIAGCAAAVGPAPWLGMLSGATPLDALGPGRPRRLVLHPMQTIVPGRGHEQLVGAFAGVTGSEPEGEALAARLAGDLGLVPVPVREADRPLPHLACTLASNAVVPPIAAALRVLGLCGIEPEAAARLLGPLVERAVANALADGPDARPTGPIARGDVGTVRRHRAALAERAPELDALYALLGRATAAVVDPAAAARVLPALGEAA